MTIEKANREAKSFENSSIVTVESFVYKQKLEKELEREERFVRLSLDKNICKL